MGGLRLDSAEGVRKGGKSGPPIVPGKPDDSLLIQAIRQTHRAAQNAARRQAQGRGDRRHRGVGEGRCSLARGRRAVVKARDSGVRDHAEQRAFWAFQPVRKPRRAGGEGRGLGADPIDRFVLAKLEAQGLKPARPADKRILIRRATFDLTGLPPTPEEVDAFLAGPLAGRVRQGRGPPARLAALRRALGPLLAGRGALLRRPAEFDQDEPYPNAFRYRDWVIQAFNDDMPYDVFVKAQIAGDLMPSTDPLQYQPGAGLLRAEPGDAGRSRGRHHARLPRPDRGLRAVPRSQVRSDSARRTTTRCWAFSPARSRTSIRWRRKTWWRRGTQQKKALDKQEKRTQGVRRRRRPSSWADILASQTARFLLAAARARRRPTIWTPRRWSAGTKYLAIRKKEHPYLKRWFDAGGRRRTARGVEAARGVSGEGA